MTAAERVEKTPDLGWERAVFAEGVTKSKSIERTTDNRMVVVIKDDIVRGTSNDSELVKKVREALGRFPKVPVKKQVINVGRKAKKETVYSEYTKYIRKNDVQKYNDKMNLLNHPYALVYVTTNYINEAPSHERKDNIVDFARGSVLMMVGNRKYAADVIVGITRTGKCELYDGVGLDDSVKFDIKKADNSKGGNPQLGKSPENELSTNTMISQNDLSVNTEFMQDSQNISEIKKSLKAEDDAPSAIDRYYAEAIRENRAFRQIFALMGDMYSSKMGEVYLDNADIRALSKKLLKEFGSKYDEAALTDELQIVFDYMANNRGNIDVDGCMKIFMHGALDKPYRI